MNRTRTSLYGLIAGSVLSVATVAQSQSTGGTQPPPGVDPATHAAHVAQGAGAHAQPTAQVDEKAEFAQQIAELRAQVARLQAALDQGHAAGGVPQPMPSGMQPGMGMSGMSGMGMSQMGSGSMPQSNSGMSGMAAGGSGMQGMSGGGGMGMMGMDNMMMGGMGGMSGGAPSGGMMDQMMGMGMSRMGGGMSMGGMASALPGFPGASHIYHVGATGFFLDHGSHITLTVEQQKQLAEIKEQSLLNQATLQRRVDQAEQELWGLTGGDEPDAAKVEAKVREIEQLKSEQRISFIRDIGKAAGVLTDDQRKQLTGMMPANPFAANQPGPMPGMGGGGMGNM